MDLDDLLNEVDINTLPADNSKKVASTADSAAKKTTKASVATVSDSNDLDAMLDEAATSNNLTGGKPAADVGAGLKIRVVSEEIRPWLAASANVPKDLREKWTKMVKADVDTEITTKFQPSYAFRAWDGPAPSKSGISRGLQEMVRKAAALSGLDESKANRLLAAMNPVTDGENGKQLQQAFAKQLLTDYADAIKQDSNYSPAQYPALAEAI